LVIGSGGLRFYCFGGVFGGLSFLWWVFLGIGGCFWLLASVVGFGDFFWGGVFFCCSCCSGGCFGSVGGFLLRFEYVLLSVFWDGCGGGRLACVLGKVISGFLIFGVVLRILYLLLVVV